MFLSVTIFKEYFKKLVNTIQFQKTASILQAQKSGKPHKYWLPTILRLFELDNY